LIGILSGIYPALKLSKNGILNSVKLQLNRVNKKNEVRKVLLFIQFSVAIIILTSTLIISKQINLFINGDMGYKKDYLLTVQVPRDWSVEGVQKMQTIQKELSELNEIKNISLSYETPNNIVGRTTISSTNGNQNPIASQMITSDSQYGITYEIPMVAGKFFSNNIVDSNRVKEIVLNKQAVQSLGFKSADEIIGKNIFLDNDEPAIVTGVTENFIANSMHSANAPIIWTNVSHNTIFRYFNIRLEAGSIANSVYKLEKRWKELMPDSPFQYQFIDDSIRKMYETELKLQKASISATFISLLIVCLGISGLVSLAIKSRNKEVGMRKILGASLYDLLVLFSKEYYIIFICSILFAVPISYLLMKIWLENYEFRVDLSVFTFLGPVILLTFLLSVLMFLILVRTTRFNPIEKLREE
jgi:ABC-type antimicrobial peptide transport system permease subunit